MPTEKLTLTMAQHERWCYCDGIDAEFRRTHNIPEGFCGICERCGQPGHTRHYPGPVPYTGAWCDRCYRNMALTWPLRVPAVWIIVIACAAMLYHILKLIFQ